MARAAVAISLVIAAGFGIAALTVRLTQAYGPALSYTMMAGLFVVIGGLAGVVMSRNKTELQPEPEDQVPSLAENVVEMATPLLDRSTIVPLLSAAGPVALPALLRLAARNLPIMVVAIIVAIFYFGRSIRSDEPATEPSGEPVSSPS